MVRTSAAYARSCIRTVAPDRPSHMQQAVLWATIDVLVSRAPNSGPNFDKDDGLRVLS